MSQETPSGKPRNTVFRFRLASETGVPVYRQIIDQVTGGLATGALQPGDQLPTVRQLAVDLAVNPNTVVRAYRELEIRGLLETQQGTGTFISTNRDSLQKLKPGDPERSKRLAHIVGECLARAGAEGFTLDEVMQQLRDIETDQQQQGRKKGRPS